MSDAEHSSHDHADNGDGHDEEYDAWETFCLKLTWILAADEDPALKEAEAILDRGYDGEVTDEDEDRLDEITGDVLERYWDDLNLARFDQIPEDNPDFAELKFSLLLLAIIDHIIARQNAASASDIGDDAANYLEDAMGFIKQAEKDSDGALSAFRDLVAEYDEAFVSSAYKFGEEHE